MNCGYVLKEFWQADGLTVRPGATTQELAQFEKRFRITLPSDFKDYLLIIDGTNDDDMPGEQLITFWTLERITLLAEEASKPLIAFADFLINSHAYAIDLTHSNTHPSVVMYDFANQIIPVAPSFTDFVALYLANSPALWPNIPNLLDSETASQNPDRHT